jgi:hypothetical protein
MRRYPDDASGRVHLACHQRIPLHRTSNRPKEEIVRRNTYPLALAVWLPERRQLGQIGIAFEVAERLVPLRFGHKLTYELLNPRQPNPIPQNIRHIVPKLIQEYPYCRPGQTPLRHNFPRDSILAATFRYSRTQQDVGCELPIRRLLSESTKSPIIALV